MFDSAIDLRHWIIYSFLINNGNDSHTLKFEIAVASNQEYL